MPHHSKKPLAELQVIDPLDCALAQLDCQLKLAMDTELDRPVPAQAAEDENSGLIVPVHKVSVRQKQLIAGRNLKYPVKKIQNLPLEGGSVVVSSLRRIWVGEKSIPSQLSLPGESRVTYLSRRVVSNTWSRNPAGFDMLPTHLSHLELILQDLLWNPQAAENSLAELTTHELAEAASRNRFLEPVFF